MNPNTFSILGYLSVLFWLAVPLLWLLRGRTRAPGWLALLLAVLSLVFATINSRAHVNRIEAERLEETADALMLGAAKRKAVEEARAGEVADIRFAEDGADDFIDKAGMDDSDRKYLESLDDTAEPEWKKQKKERGSTQEESGDLDDMLGGEDVISGVTSDSVSDLEKRPAIVMSEAHMATAHRLDRINLAASRTVLLIGILLFVVDYLSRANLYARASFPLPLPAAWRDAFSTYPAVIQRPSPPRRSMADELAWFVRRGDVFVCFTQDASALPASLPVLGKLKRPMDIIHVDGARISDEFIFEALWYGRACFVVESPERIQALFASIHHHLEQRHITRARAARNVHLVWNIEQHLHKDDLAVFENLASTAGFSLFICQEPHP